MSLEDLTRTPGRRIILVNPPVAVVDRVQLDFYADAVPYGLYQIRDWLISLGHECHIIDMMGYGKHAHGWDELIAMDELTPLEPMPSGVAGVDLPVWSYGRDFDWLETQLSELAEPPDEAWVSCSILFNAFLAHEAIARIKARFDGIRVRFGGGYPSLLPKDALKSGADEVVSGRIYDADPIQPELTDTPAPLVFAPFRLTSGCPNDCAFCINGREKLVRHDFIRVADYIERTHRRLGVELFNNWDPNVLRFKPHLKRFLDEIAARKLDVRLRFDMGFEPPLIDDELIGKLIAAKVEAFTIPLESSDPLFAAFFEKPYTIISSIRALERLQNAGYDLSQCHGSYIIGYPDEKLLDIFTTFHVIKHYRLHSTPFPIVVLPSSPVEARYGRLLENKPFAHYNGHLFPLIQNAARLNLYRRLILLLTTSRREIADKLIARFTPEVQADYHAAAARARALIRLATETDAPDSVELLQRLHAQAGQNAR